MKPLIPKDKKKIYTVVKGRETFSSVEDPLKSRTAAEMLVSIYQIKQKAVLKTRLGMRTSQSWETY